VHGVRKIAAIRPAENGATERQLNAIFGWTGRRAGPYARCGRDSQQAPFADLSFQQTFTETQSGKHDALPYQPPWIWPAANAPR
jgi:hypothetical protein